MALGKSQGRAGLGGSSAGAGPRLDQRTRAARQAELRHAFATALVARARHLGTPDVPMPAEDVARIVLSIIGGLAGDDLMEPGSVRPELLAEALAVIYSGLVARAAPPA